MANCNDPDITIVIPVWNGERHIGYTIDSILNQDYKKLRIIVSDNASTDRTSEIVKNYIATERVTYIRQEHNIGHIANFSFLIQQVKTSYYAFFCHDDYLCATDAISQAHTVMQENPKIAAVFSDMTYVNSNGKKIAQRKFRNTGTYSAKDNFKKSIISARNLFGVAILIKTSAARDFSYDNLFNYAGDLEHSFSIGEHGDLYHIAKPLFANRYHSNNLTREFQINLFEQLSALANKHDLNLTHVDRFVMKFNCWFVTLQKKLFFRYLDIFHKD